MKKIKSVSVYKTIADLKNSQDTFLAAYSQYDENGNIVEDTTYESKNVIESKTLSKFDNNNRLVEEINYIADDELTEKINYSYDDQGKVTNVKITYADGSVSNKKYNYSQENTLIIDIIDEDEEYEGKEIRIYDDKGRIIEKTIYDEFENIDEKEKLEYNEKGEIIKRIEYNVDNEIEAIINYEYDESGNLIKYLKVTNDNEVIDKVLFKYDEQGRLIEQLNSDYYITKINYEENIKIEERYDMNGIMQYRSETIYDNDGNILEEITPLYSNKYIYEYF
ncbi:MAG: hypothetical protein Kow0068_23630 [Marinilabiliales bacterium]